MGSWSLLTTQITYMYVMSEIEEDMGAIINNWDMLKVSTSLILNISIIWCEAQIDDNENPLNFSHLLLRWKYKHYTCNTNSL